MSCTTPTCVFTGNTPLMMARITGRDGSFDSAAVTQSDVSSITYTVVDANNDHTQTVGGSLTVADVFYDTLQTGDIWTTDSTGFNFAHMLSSAAIDKENHQYIVEYTVTLTDGTVFSWQYSLLGKKRYTS